MRRIRSKSVPVVERRSFPSTFIDVSISKIPPPGAQAEPMVFRLSALNRRAATAGVPCLYISDKLWAVALRLPSDGKALLRTDRPSAEGHLTASFLLGFQETRR
jgi:hypothetical protein